MPTFCRVIADSNIEFFITFLFLSLDPFSVIGECMEFSVIGKANVLSNEVINLIFMFR